MQAQVHFPVHSALSCYVSAMWESYHPGVSREVILPQGVVELLFNLGEPMVGILPNQKEKISAPDFFLQAWNSHVVDVQYTKSLHLFGLRLQPDMVKPLLGILPSESKDTLLDLSLLKNEWRSLWHQLKEAKDFKQRVAIVEKVLPKLSAIPCERTKFFCDYFSQTNRHPLLSIDALSKEVHYSTRQLNRKARNIFGVTAEELLLHKKFSRAVQFMHEGDSSLTEVAYEAGFYDQAHFCRIFKSYTGITAKEYQLKKSQLPFHLFY